MTPDDSPVETDETTQDEAISSESTQDDVVQESVAQESDAPQDDAQEDVVHDEDVQAAKEAWESSDDDLANLNEAENAKLAELAQPFVGEWNTLISTTNWEKGRIISEWREALIESGVDATMYSDEAWAKSVGGVTGPHVGRLRRVYDRFGSTYRTYDDVYWSHFLAALDWEDAPMWLEGASKETWSVSNMRDQRWQANGAVESKRPTSSEIVEVDLDEDVTAPAQGGGREKEYDGDSSGVASGPLYEEPDFGDEEELAALGGQAPPAKKGEGEAEEASGPVQPFVGLPALPDDVADAVESLKLSLLRHKTDGWKDVSIEDVEKYLEAIGIMLKA